MFQIWYGYVENVLEFLRDTKIFDHSLCLFAKMTVEAQSLTRIYT